MTLLFHQILRTVILINVIVSAGHSFDFSLHSLQTFFVFEPHVDLTGTKIISDSPLTIISGHEAARVPAGTFDAETIVTQLTPTITWGNSFLLSPHIGRSNGQSYKVIATNNETNAVKTCGTNCRAEKIKFDKNNTNWFYTANSMYTVVLSLINQSMLLKLVSVHGMLVATLVMLLLVQCHQLNNMSMLHSVLCIAVKWH